MTLGYPTTGPTTTVTLPAPLTANCKLVIDADQNVLVMADDSVECRNKTGRAWYVTMQWRLTEAQRSALRTFIHETIEYQRYAFRLNPDAGLDLGAGDGDPVNANLWQGDYTETPAGGGMWSVTLLFRTYSTGTGYPTESVDS